MNLVGRKEDPKLQELSCCGRVVKAMDLKSIGVSPRRFEPCQQRAGIDNTMNMLRNNGTPSTS